MRDRQTLLSLGNGLQGHELHVVADAYAGLGQVGSGAVIEGLSVDGLPGF